MTHATSIYRRNHFRRRHQSGQDATPWKTGPVHRQAVIAWNQGNDRRAAYPAYDCHLPGLVARPHQNRELAASPAGAFAIVPLLALAVTVIAACVFGARFLASEVVSCSTLDLIRLIGGLP